MTASATGTASESAGATDPTTGQGATTDTTASQGADTDTTAAAVAGVDITATGAAGVDITAADRTAADTDEAETPGPDPATATATATDESPTSPAEPGGALDEVSTTATAPDAVTAEPDGVATGPDKVSTMAAETGGVAVGVSTPATRVSGGPGVVSTTGVDSSALAPAAGPDEPGPDEPGPEDQHVDRSADDGGSAPGEPPAVAQASPDTVLPLPDGPAAGAATALRAPTMLAPLVRLDPPRSADSAEAAPAGSSGPDPEQVLASYHWRFHPETLREIVEDPDELRVVRDGLTERIDTATDNATRARLLSLRAVVLRILGDLGKALADGRLALAHAEATGELRRIAIAQARLAHVLQWRGDFAEADRLFAEANSSELPDRLRATMHEHAGRSCYDQGRYMEACNHFERALELRKVEDPELISRTELALDAVFNKVARNGWGPYPRTADEILQVHRAPVPMFSEESQRWGYAGADGEPVIEPAYADVQPFHDGVAWVRRPEIRNWELIDESGLVLIEAAVGYPGVSSFADGLAWVSRDGVGSWIAVDKGNRVLIPTGFEDARPFRRGVAAVRRGGWGAVDRSGKLVLPTRYDGYATALTDGRYVEGFTDEGLAIVHVGGRKGVVDRTGRSVVPLAHPALVIHPVAFLIGNGAGQWGALDRRGEPLIDVAHPSRTDVMDEIDRLLADTTPVL